MMRAGAGGLGGSVRAVALATVLVAVFVSGSLGVSLAYGEQRGKCSRSTLRTVKRFKTGAILIRRVPNGSTRTKQVYGCLYSVNRFDAGRPILHRDRAAKSAPPARSVMTA